MLRVYRAYQPCTHQGTACKGCQPRALGNRPPPPSKPVSDVALLAPQTQMSCDITPRPEISADGLVDDPFKCGPTPCRTSNGVETLHVKKRELSGQSHLVYVVRHALTVFL